MPYFARNRTVIDSFELNMLKVMIFLFQGCEWYFTLLINITESYNLAYVLGLVWFNSFVA